MVIHRLISDLAHKLNDNAVFEATQIVMYATGLDHTGIILNSRKNVSDSEYKKAIDMVSRRLQGEPLQYILGFTEFMGLEFEVNPNVLIPRADTETLVETVIKRINGKKKSLLDIGTGSGCVGISIAHFEQQTDVSFLDVSVEALSITKINAVKNGISGTFINMDILNKYPECKYDIIVSNPPYIRPDVIDGLQKEVKDFEPYIALYGGDDGLMFYRRITDIACKILNPSGLLAFEIGFDQGKAVSDIMKKNFTHVSVIQDMCGNDRVVLGKIQ